MPGHSHREMRRVRTGSTHECAAGPCALGPSDLRHRFARFPNGGSCGCPEYGRRASGWRAAPAGRGATLLVSASTCRVCVNRNTSTSASLSGLGAREAIERVRRGELRAEDSVADLLGRQRRLASLNALTRIDEQQVLEDARRIDRKRAAGAVLGVLAGLPVVIKDNIAVAGTPNAAGTLTLRDNVARQNAPVVQRLLDQDAIFFARANMHELAGGGTSSNPSFGVVGNPYDPQRVPGGSSGGTAAALAARLAPAGLGSDTAGSVRIPSALCGTAGLRPTIRPHKLPG